MIMADWSSIFEASDAGAADATTPSRHFLSSGAPVVRVALLMPIFLGETGFFPTNALVIANTISEGSQSRTIKYGANQQTSVAHPQVDAAWHRASMQDNPHGQTLHGAKRPKRGAASHSASPAAHNSAKRIFETTGMVVYPSGAKSQPRPASVEKCNNNQANGLESHPRQPSLSIAPPLHALAIVP